MAPSSKQKKLEEVIEKTRESLVRSAWFEAERLAQKALIMAKQDHDFERMAAVVPLMQEARRQRLRLAVESGRIAIMDEPITEDMKIKPGCYIVRPPQVGSDARRMRLAALSGEVPVVVICREPLTKTKLLPIVAISPGSTIRVKVEPPAKLDAPDVAWFVSALEALGDWALESMDATLPVTRKIEALLEHIDALPEHENLHLALEAACREAHTAQSREKAAPAKGIGKSKVRG